MMIDFTNTNFLYFVLYPLITLLVLFFINIAIYLNKRSSNVDVNSTLKNNWWLQIKTWIYFLFFLSMISVNIVYWYIIYAESIDIEVWTNALYIFSFLNIISILAKNVVFFFFLKFIWIQDIKKFKAVLSMAILWIAIAESPAIFWLIYMFNELSL